MVVVVDVVVVVVVVDVVVVVVVVEEEADSLFSTVCSVESSGSPVWGCSLSDELCSV